jgi:hypothetical protein
MLPSNVSERRCFQRSERTRCVGGGNQRRSPMRSESPRVCSGRVVAPGLCHQRVAQSRRRVRSGGPRVHPRRIPRSAHEAVLRQSCVGEQEAPTRHPRVTALTATWFSRHSIRFGTRSNDAPVLVQPDTINPRRVLRPESRLPPNEPDRLRIDRDELRILTVEQARRVRARGRGRRGSPFDP